MNIDRDLGEIHGIQFCAARGDGIDGEPRTRVDIHLAGEGMAIDADSHVLMMKLPKGDEVRILLVLRDQIQTALSQTHAAITSEIDARLGAMTSAIDDDRAMEAADMRAEMASVNNDESPLAEPLS